jgi:hypothetical protein
MRCPGCRQSNTLPDSQPIGALQIPRIRSGRATPGPRNQSSTRSAIGLIKHAAAGERIWFQHYLSGLPEAECDGFAQRGEGSFAVSDDETLSDVIAEFERAGCRSRSIAEQYDLEHTVLRGQTVGTNLMFDPFLPWATLPPKTPSARPAAPPAHRIRRRHTATGAAARPHCPRSRRGPGHQPGLPARRGGHRVAQARRSSDCSPPRRRRLTDDCLQGPPLGPPASFNIAEIRIWTDYTQSHGDPVIGSPDHRGHGAYGAAWRHSPSPN